MTTRALRDEFRKDPALSIHLSDDLLRNAVWRGVEEGVFVYRSGDLLAGPGDPRPSIHVDDQAVVFTMDYARKQGIWPRTEPEPTAPPDPAGGRAPDGGGGGGATDPDPQPEAAPQPPTVFSAEGVLKAALAEMFEKAQGAGVERLKRVSVKLTEPSDAFKLVGIARGVPNSTKTVKLEGGFRTTDGSEMEFEFTGSAKDAADMREYLDQHFRAAEEKHLVCDLSFGFVGGLSLTDGAAKKFADQLTRYASTAAYVEAEAEAV